MVAACDPPPSPADATVDVADETDRADSCVPVREDDAALRYTVCRSDINPTCARVVYPDGAVNDPTFC